MVGRSIWGPVDRKKMPSGSCLWLDVLVFIRPAPYFAAGIQVYRKAGEKQPGWLSVRTKRNGGSNDSVAEFVRALWSANPGLAGLEDCESLPANLKTKKMVGEKYVVRHFLGTHQALEEGDLDNASTEVPADGLTEVRGDMVPLLRLLESGCFSPGSLRPRKGAAWRE